MTLHDNFVCSFDNEPFHHSYISITNCQSEEADQRIIRHVLHIVDNYDEFKWIVVDKIDTDVLILLISFVGQMENVDPGLQIYAQLTAGTVSYTHLTLPTKRIV